ncbi:uncharacterized protein FOMMEDRAFT_147287 [Fomitiporia mediterranea MF3/22]|uniref:uncharacterized protein n=1 Tax=Fomitiporia mediterranea (strain MF3/22) TaxID=694068 RepID=UPI00044072FA|nr:uncharacterized protein FOMMEDRAFT_147287 [Fomitiporia mediterranea MF3/22]EJD02251.1 hypothetical protein FOMMEDRAFT_147287 [Fomitiporia mediterranea MF3/22]
MDLIPAELAHLVSRSKAVSLSRQRQDFPVLDMGGPKALPSGMSPKKFHEVSRMTTYVLGLLDAFYQEHGTKVQHIVDIGAGQNYKGYARNLHVLALDSSSNQSGYPGSRIMRSDVEGTLTYRTLWLGQEPTFASHPGNFGQERELGDNADFEQTIDEWLHTFRSKEDPLVPDDTTRSPIPVVFVALHACGSLTPAILQKILDHQECLLTQDRPWCVAGAVIVGCCYNLMREDDFPLSRTLQKHIEQKFHGFSLSASHLQLAAQVPSQWLSSPESEAAADLAIRKIVYRALATPALSYLTSKDTGFGEDSLKLGKLNKKAYESFRLYLERAGQKLESSQQFPLLSHASPSMRADSYNDDYDERGFVRSDGLDAKGTGYLTSNRGDSMPDFSGSETNLLSVFKHVVGRDPEEAETSSPAILTKALHALRCLLGPPVESLIVLDRYLWLHEELSGTPQLEVRLVNLFSQEAGSGRNVGIVIGPRNCSINHED